MIGPPDLAGATPPLTDWRGLTGRGFPYLKVQLIREDPLSAGFENWRRELKARGYDPTLAETHLGRGGT